MAAAADTPVWVGVVRADTAVSLLDGVELVCAPPELCPILERGPAFEALLGDEVDLAWVLSERCTIRGFAPEEEPADGSDEFVADFGPVGDVLAAESDAEPEADDDESDDERDEADDELERLVSVGSANATAGVFATVAPTPSPTANTPARTMFCACTVIALRARPERSLEPA